MKGPVVLAGVAPVDDAPSAPVQTAPCGQQATTLLRSAEQTAVRGQQSPAAFKLVHA